MINGSGYGKKKANLANFYGLVWHWL